MSDEQIQKLRQLDQNYHVHPFTNHNAMHERGTHIMKSGEGCYVIDQNDRRLLDGLAGLWCVNIGNGQKEVIDSICQQLSKLSFYPSFFNTTTESTINLAARLSELAPKNLKHVMFCNSGSEANETALKVIRAINKIKGTNKKKKILTRSFSYHGVTMATTSMTGLPSCTEPFNLPIADYIQVPGPYAYEAGKEDDPVSYGNWCLSETERIIEQEGADTIAALFAEPIQGAGGVIVPPPGYLIKLRDLCKSKDILFVADEVITGFGRIGNWFASNKSNLNPDIMTLAKGITSGYIPLGATLISDEINSTLNGAGYWAHGYTYSGHPVATAAALANIDFIERHGLIDKVNLDTGVYFQSKLNALKNHTAVGEVRGEGLIAAIELLPSGGRSQLNATLNLGIKMADLVRNEGAIVRGIRNLIAIAPALIITRDEIDILFSAIEKSLDRLN